jgi:hypothetical protein
MKYMLVLFIAIPLLLGCGHLTGNNPEGVTGGHEGGYGSFGTSFSGGYYPDLLGAWHQDAAGGMQNIITFRIDGLVNVDLGADQSSRNGSYLVSGNRLDINVYGWQSGSGEFVIDGNTMTINFSDGAVTLQR